MSPANDHIDQRDEADRDTVVGILDVEIAGHVATIGTIATHPGPRAVEYSFKSTNKSNVNGTGFAYLTSGPGQVGTNGSWTQGNGKNYKGTVLTVGVGMGVVIYVPPYNGDRMWDGGKTKDANCSATTCHY